MDYKKIVSNFVGYYGQDFNVDTMDSYYDKTKPINNPIYNNSIPNYINHNDLCLAFYDGKNIKILPLNIMFIRHIVHDVIYIDNKKINVSISYSPLTGSPVIYKGKWKFSGILYNNNDVLVMDNNLLIQILGVIVSGDKIGFMPERWSVILIPFNKIYTPECLILQGEINDEYNYTENLYKKYIENEYIKYPIERISNNYNKKKIVYVVNKNNKNLSRSNKKNILIIINKKSLENKKNIKYKKDINTYILEKDSFIIPMYFFASYAFY